MKLAIPMAFAVVVGACASADTTSPDAGPTGPTGPSGPSPAGMVEMQSSIDPYGTGAANAFSPQSVTISRTGSVTWTNPTGVTHNVTFAPASGTPADIPAHSSGSNTRDFNTVGTFAYQCTLHSGMSGTVVVQ